MKYRNKLSKESKDAYKIGSNFDIHSIYNSKYFSWMHTNYIIYPNGKQSFYKEQLEKRNESDR